jgi:hypothetical protein
MFYILNMFGIKINNITLINKTFECIQIDIVTIIRKKIVIRINIIMLIIETFEILQIKFRESNPNLFIMRINIFSLININKTFECLQTKKVDFIQKIVCNWD